MFLPGIFAALKGETDAIVTVAALLITATAMEMGVSGWGMVPALAIGLWMNHKW